MRPIDRKECDAMSGGKPHAEILGQLLRRSVIARAAYVDGSLLAIYGLVRKTLLSGEANPWALFTPAIEDPLFRRVVIKHSKSEFADIAERAEKMWNLVHAENTVAIRWLRWLGFEFPDGKTYMVNDEPFELFGMEKDCVH